jgi:predicted phosphoribosyltransferase
LAVRSVLTAQYREFTSLSDNDVESFLRQLQELGFLDELSTTEGNTK